MRFRLTTSILMGNFLQMISFLFVVLCQKIKTIEVILVFNGIYKLTCLFLINGGRLNDQTQVTDYN